MALRAGVTMPLHLMPSATTFTSDALIGIRWVRDGFGRAVISSITAGTPASERPELRAGLVLDSINDVPVTTMAFGRCISMIRSMRPICLGFNRQYWLDTASVTFEKADVSGDTESDPLNASIGIEWMVDQGDRLVINTVREGSLAARQHVRPGMILKAVNGTPTNDVDFEHEGILETIRAAQKVTLELSGWERTDGCTALLTPWRELRTVCQPTVASSVATAYLGIIGLVFALCPSAHAGLLTTLCHSSDWLRRTIGWQLMGAVTSARCSDVKSALITTAMACAALMPILFFTVNEELRFCGGSEELTPYLNTPLRCGYVQMAMFGCVVIGHTFVTIIAGQAMVRLLWS
jgi:hypothetical protein